MPPPNDNDAALWKAPDAQVVPVDAMTAQAIVPYARQLNQREARQILQAYEAGSFEIGASFVWMKAMMSLKQQLSTLGVEFVGEMLERPDFTPGTSVIQAVTDYEAIRLAEELGAFSGRQGMRLRHALEVVTHAPEHSDGDDPITPEEALGCLRTCVQTILSQDRMESAVEFIRFRQDLESKTFNKEDPDIQLLAGSSYFFKRTTLRVLLALLKTSDGARLQHVAANLNVLLPILWSHVLDPDKWAVGRTYAESYAAGRSSAAEGVRRALLLVKGFDYVPENLRSNSYVAAANKVIEAHFSYNNYNNEIEPMKALSSLGSVIPPAAFDRCMTALLCVKLGNRYGHSYVAVPISDSMLGSLRADQWLYYLKQCLIADTMVLDKISSEGRMPGVWCKIVQSHDLANIGTLPQEVRFLIDASNRNEIPAVIRYASRMRQALAPN